MEIFFRADWFSKGQGRAGTGECLLKIALFYEEGDLKERENDIKHNLGLITSTA